MNLKGSQKSTTNQSNNPPAWALPLFQKVASEAMGLYNSGQGFNTYRGPTVAEYSPQTLEGLNRTMMMTGSTGPKITNESVFHTDQIKQIQAMIDQQVKDEAARKAAAAAAAAAAAKQPQVVYRDRYPEQLNRGGHDSPGYSGMGGPGGNSAAGSYGWSGGGMGGHGYGGVGGYGSGSSGKSSGGKGGKGKK